MREIKFRGKSCDEWVYGHLLKKEKDEVCCVNCESQHSNYLIQTDELDKYNEYDQYYITDDDTIGQYTGIKDENDIEIYEGDIIKFSYDAFIGNFDTFTAKGIVVFEDGAFFVNCLENERNIKDERFLLYEINIDVIEIIGNIYDNPELLKESD